MTLISCPECKKEISDKSEHCIECGAPQHVILGAAKETTQESKEVSDITLKFSDIILKSAISTFLFILILIIKMFIVFGISVGITGSVGPSNYIAIGGLIALITTFLIVRRIYFSKFMKRLLSKRFIKKYFALTGFLIAFILWFIIIHLTFISAFKNIKEGHVNASIEGLGLVVYFLAAFITSTKIPLGISFITSIIGKLVFKQSFNHLLGTQILLFTVIYLIYIHFIYI